LFEVKGAFLRGTARLKGQIISVPPSLESLSHGLLAGSISSGVEVFWFGLVCYGWCLCLFYTVFSPLCMLFGHEPQSGHMRNYGHGTIHPGTTYAQTFLRICTDIALETSITQYSYFLKSRSRQYF